MTNLLTIWQRHDPLFEDADGFARFCELAFVDKDGRVRPRAPGGFTPFKWKTKPYELDKNIRLQLCPVCGESGFVWNGGGFVNPNAERFLEESEKKNLNQFDVFCQYFEGVMIKEHWSRYGVGECTECGCEFWHDFVGGGNRETGYWQYYYKSK